MAETLISRMRRYSDADVEKLLEFIAGGDETITEEERHGAINDALDLCMAVREWLASEAEFGIPKSDSVNITFAADKDGRIKLTSGSQEGERVLRKGEVLMIYNNGGQVHAVKRKQ